MNEIKASLEKHRSLLEAKILDELRMLAKTLQLTGYTKLHKAKLVDLIITVDCKVLARHLSSSKKDSVPWIKSPTELCVVGIVAAALISYSFNYLTAKDSKRVQLRLDDLFMEKYAEELKNKYPGGYMLMSIDSSKNKTKTEFIPSKSNFREEYELDWDRMEIGKITKDRVTLKLPTIRYKPQNTLIHKWEQTLPRLPIGKSYPFMINWHTNKYKLHIELVEDKETSLAIAVGFKLK